MNPPRELNLAYPNGLQVRLSLFLSWIYLDFGFLVKQMVMLTGKWISWVDRIQYFCHITSWTLWSYEPLRPYCRLSLRIHTTECVPADLSSSAPGPRRPASCRTRARWTRRTTRSTEINRLRFKRAESCASKLNPKGKISLKTKPKRRDRRPKFLHTETSRLRVPRTSSQRFCIAYQLPLPRYYICTCYFTPVLRI